MRGGIVSKTSPVETFPFLVKVTRRQHSLVIIQRRALCLSEAKNCIMSTTDEKSTKKSVSIFALFSCCLKGQSRPKAQRKSGAYDKKDAVPVEEGKEANEDRKNSSKSRDFELEYQPDQTEPIISPSDEYKPTYDEASTAPDTPQLSVASEEDPSYDAPGSIQVVQDSAMIHPREVGTGGRLSLQFTYDPETSKLTLLVLSLEFPPFQNWKMDDLEVSCMLLPVRQHSFRVRPKKFKDPLTMVLTPKERVKQMSLRFRLYDHRAMSKHMIGQGVVNLGEVKLGPQAVTIALDMSIPETYGIDSRYIVSVAGEGGQTPAEDSKPELLLSLEYRALTRKLIAEVIKTRNLGLLNNSKPQDVAVELRLVGENNAVLRVCRTTLKRHVIDAEFNEMFMFRITYEKLAFVSVIFTLYRVGERRAKRENIGEVCFGKQSSSYQQQNHWNDVVKGNERVITQWHPFFK